VPNTIEITLIGKPGCHLCETALGVVNAVIDEFVLSKPGNSVVFLEANILEDPELARKYGEEIPVVLVNGAQHSYWTVEARRLLAKLQSLA
jgi:hypothetical protein